MAVSIRVARCKQSGGATLHNYCVHSLPRTLKPISSNVAVNATVSCGYSNTVRLADCVVPLYEPEIVTVVEMRTIDVFTVKVALVAPPGTVTLAGTLATEGLLLKREMTAPPLGAGALNVTLPVEDPSRPPTTIDGFRVSEATVGSGALTVSVAGLLVTLPDELLTTTTNCAPLSDEFVGGVV